MLYEVITLLLTRDTGRTSAFYRDVLGLVLREEEHGGRHKHYGCQLGTIYFTIQSAADLAAPDPGRGYDFLQLCFTVSDLDPFIRHLEELKVTVITSYSIHYTKLYDRSRLVSCRTGDRHPHAGSGSAGLERAQPISALDRG